MNLGRSLKILLVIGLYTLGQTPGRAEASSHAVLVFAAASLTPSLSEIAKLYRTRSPVKINLSFAASSSLARQITSGAPADIYISANKIWMDYVAERRALINPSPLNLIFNRLVLAVPKPGSSNATLTSAGLAAILKQGRLGTGDPDHVPAGLYGKQALTYLGLWDEAKDKLARSVNVRAALALLERRETAAAILYQSDVTLSRKTAIAYTFPRQSHAPIAYPAGILSGRDWQEVKDFFKYLSGGEARSIFVRHGFVAD